MAENVSTLAINIYVGMYTLVTGLPEDVPNWKNKILQNTAWFYPLKGPILRKTYFASVF